MDNATHPPHTGEKPAEHAAHAHTATPAHAHASHDKKPTPMMWGAGVLVVLVLVVAVGMMWGGTAPPASDNVVDPNMVKGASTQVPAPSVNGSPDALKVQLSKAKYIKEVFTVRREDYDLFEKAAAYRGETLEQTKQFFFDCCSLTSEEDIFSQLPPIPADFGDVAFDLQTGRAFQIGLLGPQYYKQPEFYFNGLETALANRTAAFRPWVEPQLQYWGDYGLTTYPNKQYDTLSKTNRKTFKATVFVTNGWDIQNFVGVHLIPTNADSKLFDLKISEDQTGKPYFLLGPSFPQFAKDWATKVVIEGEVKGDTPPGTYTIGINPIAPPKELSEKWSKEYTGVYVPYGFLSPSGNYIDLVITVEP